MASVWSGASPRVSERGSAEEVSEGPAQTRTLQSETASTSEAETGSAYAMNYMQSLHSKAQADLMKRHVSVNSTAHKLRARTHMWHSMDTDIFSSGSSASSTSWRILGDTSKILDAHLDVRRRDAWLRLLRLDRLFQAARKERQRRARPDYEHAFPLINQTVKTTTFELVFGVVMCVNAALIGIQTSVEGTIRETEVYEVMEHVFTLLFTAEVIVRLMSDGWPWLLNPMNAWDAILIFFTGVVPMWFLQPLGVDSSSLRLFSLVRVLRMIKLVRTVRMVPMFHILYHLVSGLLGSMRLLLFTYAMMGITLYILAVFAVHSVSKLTVFRNDEVVQEHFATVPLAALTLLQVATCEWTQLARLLMLRSWIIVGICVVVIMVVTLVLFNLITAAMCNAANDRAKDDEEILARVKRDAIAAEIRELEDLFWELDVDRNGTISKHEYRMAVNANQRVKAKFNLLGLGPEDAEEIWQWLVDDSGGVEIDAFTHTLRVLQGNALAKDSFAILKRVQITNERTVGLREKLELLMERAGSLRGQALALDKELGQALVDLSDFLAGLGSCMPREAAVPRRRTNRFRTCESEASVVTTYATGTGSISTPQGQGQGQGSHQPPPPPGPRPSQPLAPQEEGLQNLAEFHLQSLSQSQSDTIEVLPNLAQAALDAKASCAHEASGSTQNPEPDPEPEEPLPGASKEQEGPRAADGATELW